MKNTWPNYLPGPKHLTLGLHIHQTTCQLPEGSSSRVVAQPQRKFSVSVQERKVSKVSKEPTKHGNKIRTEPTQLNHYSLVKSTRGAPRYFSDGKGRVLSEEERAAENVYIQKMERERLEKLKLKQEKEKAEKEKQGADKRIEGSQKA